MLKWFWAQAGSLIRRFATRKEKTTSSSGNAQVVNNIGLFNINITKD